MDVKCPFCESTKHTKQKSWKYGPNKKIDVYLLKCECRQTFNYYQSAKSTWTNPKSQKLK
jgi:hypothetical protein